MSLKKPSEIGFEVPAAGRTTALVYRSPEPRGQALVLAHGAGAPQQSGFLVGFARALTPLGIDVATFNFLYMEQRRKAPDRAPLLEACYRAAIDAVARELDRDELFIGGKSMGGRIATQVAAADPSLAIDGVVLLGYPLHPPGRPDQRRDAHLPKVGRPMLFVQGARDAFGTPEELIPIVRAIGASASIHIVDGGDHSFKLSRKDPAAEQVSIAVVVERISEWMESVRASARTRRRSG